jgi:copper(I)-binding protein/uncharacterized protein YcnI
MPESMMPFPKTIALMSAVMSLTASSAFSHVFIQGGEAKPGASYRAVVSVPHGCKGAATTRLTVHIPDGLIAVKPMPKPGWSIETTSGPYARAYPYRHGATMSEGVKEVTWSGELRDDFYDEFVFTGFVAEGVATPLVVPTIQSCGDAVERWTELPKAGQSPHDLANPAPIIRVAGAAGAAERQVKKGAISISNPWVRATPPAAKVGGGYLVLSTSGTEPDRLIGGSAPGVERIEVHQMKMEGDVMRMRPVPNGLEIKPGSPVKLEPNGYHLMFMGLRQPFKVGETVKATLTFEKAGPVEVEFKVEAVGFSGAAAHQH